MRESKYLIPALPLAREAYTYRAGSKHGRGGVGDFGTLANDNDNNNYNNARVR